jgi:hypothetical protein
MEDFDSRLSRICEFVLSEALGQSGWNPVTHSVSRFGISSADCSTKPWEFDDALVDLFQPIGALLIETRILTRFYRSIGARYSRSDDLNFSAEVEKARAQFEKLRSESTRS